MELLKFTEFILRKLLDAESETRKTVAGLRKDNCLNEYSSSEIYTDEYVSDVFK